MPEQVRLRIHGYGNIELKFTTEYLVDLESAYNSIFLFESFVEDLSRNPIYLDRWDRIYSTYPGGRGLGSMSRDDIDAGVPRGERLVLASVQINSPGFWEFLGNLNPLEVIRKYLNDRHERRKDRDYRETAEARKLTLENLKRENEVLAERIKLARDLGATNYHLATMLDRLIQQPLFALERHQDRGVIEHAEIVLHDQDTDVLDWRTLDERKPSDE